MNEQMTALEKILLLYSMVGCEILLVAVIVIDTVAYFFRSLLLFLSHSNTIKPEMGDTFRLIKTTLMRKQDGNRYSY